MRSRPWACLVRIVCFTLATAIAVWATAVPLPAASRPAARARHAMVAGPEPLAVTEGLKVLREGGNAVDAAVTIGFVLAVTLPQAGNIGGGGYMLIRMASGETVFVDYRETAPATASRDMFLDASGDVIPGASTRTYRAVGVPATVSGLALALGKYGTIPLERALAPAIRLADEGFIIDRGLGRALKWGSRRLERYPASKAIFYHDDRPLAEGERLVQKDLARTLSSIARQGPRAFYEGRIARTLARDMTSHGGLITLEDLARYRPILREPVSGSYRSFEVLSAPPSSSGGIALIQMLHMLEPFPLGSMGQNSSAYIHHVAEAMKRAFADRSRWLGDPEFFDVPVKSLTSIPYARRMMRNFEPDRATPAPEAGPGNPFAHEGTTTTHFSVVDDQGSAVSNTYTLNSWFGNGAIVEGLGFLLNNEMDDFSSKPDTPNSYGLIGGEANSIAPNKRMLSSMSPTIVLKKGPGDQKSLYLVLGSPGGPTIITSVLQTMLDVMDFGMELQAAVDAPRFHHQWDPDRLFLDKGGFPRDVIDALVRMGYDVRERSPHGDIQAIQVDRESGWLYGASDPRGWGVSRGY